MNLTGRPVMPKSPRIKNGPLIQLYRRNNPNCEVCLMDGDIYTDVELHHIVGGLGRSDLKWNIISLCHNHHVQATYHISGGKAALMNIALLGIKYLKNEISEKRLSELKLLDEVKLFTELMNKKWDDYRKGLLVYE